MKRKYVKNIENIIVGFIFIGGCMIYANDYEKLGVSVGNYLVNG